ncbi:MAG: acyl-CoA dehydrogenase family protein [Acidimicrobiia bacterium]|nr:acyl-CoA dehydrogenase family protein [Acidimicrobiia bacterium]
MAAAHTVEEIRAEVDAWLDENWSEELTVREWWSRLAGARYAMPGLDEPWGRGYDRAQARAVTDALRARRAMGPPGGIGTSLSLPTILHHGTPAQIERFVPRILDGSEGWCQLFSEPNAGSDLAGLQTRAERDGDEWVVNGQKVWTSTGQHADHGILIARTDPDLPKHEGISYFLFPMRQPGVDVRPLVEMTGHAVFNEVFLDDARVANENLLGGLNRGWAVANTTLTHERAGIGDTGGGFGRANPGTVAGHLDRPVSDFTASRPAIGQGTVTPRTVGRIRELAAERGCLDDPVVRQGLAALHTRVELIGMNAQRWKVSPSRTGVEGNVAKILMAETVEAARELLGHICGAHAQLTGASDELTSGWLGEFFLFSPAPSIYGGTDQVQRNIIGERGLGLPKEPGPARETPFRELLANR